MAAARHAALFSAAAARSAAAAAPPVDADLWVGGQGGYACYRLPNLLQLREPGHLLALAQGHKYDCSDGGRMDILARRSSDHGATWSAPALAYGESTPARNVTMGTPAAVVDMVGDAGSGVAPGTVHLFICRDFQQVLLLSSADGGASWGAPRDLSATLVPAEWTGVWTGLPQGVQLRSGRLIVCANHGVASGGTHSHTIYSDDHGATWVNGKSVSAHNSTAQHMGECSLAETSAGLYMYARVWWDDGEPGNGRSTRALAVSTDGGASFSDGDTAAFPGNPGTDTQGALVYTQGRFLVGSPWGYAHFPRNNYTVLVSEAVGGRPSSWRPMPGADPLWPGAAQYSTLLAPGDDSGTVWVVYERSATLASQNGLEVLRLTQLRLP